MEDKKMRASERLLKYVQFRTPSDENCEQCPSSDGQFELAKYLVEELHNLGIEDAYVDGHCYVYAHIPASPGKENCTPIGFIAHMDTVSDYCDKDVTIQITDNYDGGDLALGNSGLVLSPQSFPHLETLKGRTLITSDGETILGADDKAGIAEIITAAEQLMEREHGPISIGFTPDEEIGRGADLFNVEEFGAKFAFTIDGDTEGEVQIETFNAARAKVTFTGENVHPGSAKDVMVNAAILAMEFDAMLPSAERPEKTEDYEGFYHLTSIKGDVASAETTYILRDHFSSRMQAKKDTMTLAAKLMNEKYGEGTVKLEIVDQYNNMREVLENYPELTEKAFAACRATGVEPIVIPVRGGTDGAELSFKGLPCPNLGTGGHAFHGPYEHITVEGMDKVVEIVLALVDEFCE